MAAVAVAAARNLSLPNMGPLILAGLCLAALCACHASAASVSLPMRFKAEGKLKMTYWHKTQSIVHELVFTEAQDSYKGQTSFSIGYVSHQPNIYAIRKGSKIISLNEDNVCVPVLNKHYVPELEWFVDLMLHTADFREFLQEGWQIGAIGLIELFHNMNIGGDSAELTRTTVHRKIACNVHSRRVHLKARTPPTDGASLVAVVEVYVPVPGVLLTESHENYFSYGVKIQWERPDERGGEFGTQEPVGEILIDFYSIDLMSSDASKAAKLSELFNMPMGSGCSEFLNQITPERRVPALPFSMAYQLHSGKNLNFLAYDPNANLLRQHMEDGSASVWDLKEQLLYHRASQGGRPEIEVPSSFEGARTHACSVLQVQDEQLSGLFRPAKQDLSRSVATLDLLTLIGAHEVAYMGRGTVRDLPCYVYETLADEVPPIFQLAGLAPGPLPPAPPNQARSDKYIVQYHLPVAGDEPESVLAEANLWPARVSLLRRRPTSHNNSYTLELVDQMEVMDFYWSLDGWDKKAAELFMAPECFDESLERIRLEMAVRFNEIHFGIPSDNDRKLLASNKFRLEQELLEEVFGSLRVSRMHLLEYEMKLQPRHVGLSMLIGDRSESRRLHYYGEGALEWPAPNGPSRFTVEGRSELQCVLGGSLVDGSSLVLHCPAGRASSSKCTVVTGEAGSGAVLKGTRAPDASLAEQNGAPPPCRAYRLLAATPPNRATLLVEAEKMRLGKLRFKFAARIPRTPGWTRVMSGFVDDFDVQPFVQVQRLEHYAFAAPSATNGAPPRAQRPGAGTQQAVGWPRVRSLGELAAVRAEPDCVRLCQLDSACRSYAYCPAPANGAGPGPGSATCQLSALDLRAEPQTVAQQLANSRAPLVSASQPRLTVLGDAGHAGAPRDQYELEFAEPCSISERNYLDMFTQTDEVVRVDSRLVQQYRATRSAFACAKMGVDAELAGGDQPRRPVSMFAYCSGVTNACILDEQLFTLPAPAPKSGSLSGVPPAPPGAEMGIDEDQESTAVGISEVLCRIYRRRYQTYFHLSAEVLREEGEGEEEEAAAKGGARRQVRLALASVEECAHACWGRLGATCASFDFCTPNRCLVNTLTAGQAAERQLLELRAGCLHYERDLGLDELRRRHLLGRHELFAAGPDSGEQADTEAEAATDGGPAPAPGANSWGLLVDLLVGALTLGAFVYGLSLGRTLNDKIESVTVLQSHGDTGPLTGGRPSSSSASFPSAPGGLFPRSLEEAAAAARRRLERMTAGLAATAGASAAGVFATASSAAPATGAPEPASASTSSLAASSSGLDIQMRVFGEPPDAGPDDDPQTGGAGLLIDDADPFGDL